MITLDEYTEAAKARLFKLYPANLTQNIDYLLGHHPAPPAAVPPPRPPPPSNSPYLRAPTRGLGIRAAMEKGMAEGRGVNVTPGIHSWDDNVLAVWPRSHLRVTCRRGTVQLTGKWEIAEGSCGSVARANLTHRVPEPGDETMWVRGAEWCFEECDIRCLKGIAVRVTNGWHEIVSGEPLAPFQLFAAVTDAEAAILPSNVSFVLCGLGGVDPERSLRPGHLDPEERQVREGCFDP